MTRGAFEFLVWSIGILGSAGAAVSAMIAPAAFPHAWLAATVAWMSWPIGCMGLLLIHALTGGNWGYAIRLQLVSGMSTLALAPFALIPLALVAPRLYLWFDPSISARMANGFYLNLPGFVARCVVYLGVWFALARVIARALRGEGADARLARIAPLGLMLLALTVTFASIDAIMALEPRFASSVFGLLRIVETGLLALSVSVLGAVFGQSRSEMDSALGRLLLALIILWIYLDFVQLLIVWQSDLPHEASWYLKRWSGGWGVTAGLVVLLHFALPFALLLSPRLQGSRSAMALIAGLLAVAAILRCWWLVLPASSASFSIVPVLAMLGVWGIAAGFALRASRAAWRAPQGVRRNASRVA